MLCHLGGSGMQFRWRDAYRVRRTSEGEGVAKQRETDVASRRSTDQSRPRNLYEFIGFQRDGSAAGLVLSKVRQSLESIGT